MDSRADCERMLDHPAEPGLSFHRSKESLPQGGAKEQHARSLRAGITQLVECKLPKLDVAGSSPVARSIHSLIHHRGTSRMSIFRREVEPPPAKPVTPPRPARPSAPPREASAGRDITQIASGSKVVGEVLGKARLVVDGVVEGSIRLESEVIVGAQGRVDGTVVAENVQVGGKVHGNIRGIKKVEVLSSGHLEGDVKSPSVVILDGAFFKGKVEMTNDVGTVHNEPGESKGPPPKKAEPPRASGGSVSAPGNAAVGAGSGDPRKSPNSNMGRKGKGGR